MEICQTTNDDNDDDGSDDDDDDYGNEWLVKWTKSSVVVTSVNC